MKYKKLVIVLLLCCLFIPELNATTIEFPAIEYSNSYDTCGELLGDNLIKILSLAFSIVRIGGIIIAIIHSMVTLIPTIINEDKDSLPKALKTIRDMFIILVLLLLLPTIVRAIGLIFDYDISCFV